MMPGYLVAAAVAGLLTILTYALGYRRSARRYDIIVEVPTVQARDVPGLGAAMVEVKGRALVDEPLTSDLARLPCVAFDCQVTEHWTTTRTKRDSKGHTRIVTEHHSETRYANSGRISFQVEDDSGRDAVVVATVWDTEEDADTFRAAVEAWFRKRFPKGTLEQDASGGFSVADAGKLYAVSREGQSLVCVLGLPAADGRRWQGR